MNQKSLCTVIIPTIGRPKYFGPALASVAAQTYGPLKILVSDNAASQPIERAEIEKWAPRADVRLVRRPTRLTGAEHINLCLNEAEGEYLFLMSDDDLIAPAYLDAGMECLLSDPSVGLVVAQQTKIDEAFLGPVSNSPIRFKTLPGNDYVARWFTEGDPGVLTVFPMLARRMEVLKCGGFRTYPDASHSDNTLFLQLCLGAKVGLLDGGYYYRVYPTSAGLGTPWWKLLLATQQYEQDLLDLHKEGRLDRKLFLAILRGNTQLLLTRWTGLYRHRSGFQNRARPVLDMARRLLSLGVRYGPGSLPKVHKLTGNK